MPYRPRALALLERWRDIDRRLAGVPVDSSAAEELRAAALALRDEYQALIEQATREDLPIPPPFPETGKT